MNKIKKSIIKYISLLGILFVCLIVSATQAQGKTILTKNQTATYLDKISEYEVSKVPNPTYGSVGGEWLIMGLARYGTLTESYRNIYLNNLKAEVEKCNGVLSERKYTEYARVVLALTSLEADPGNFAGYNLLEPLAELDNVIKMGVNGAAFALLAFDCGNYTIPDTKKEYMGTKASREQLISILLNAQLADGGWANAGSKSDIDITAMVIQVLGKYYQQDKVKNAVDKAVKLLSTKQNDSGDFSSAGSENCESTAQVLTAMTVLGIKVSDSRFIKNDNTILDGLLKYYKDGGFKHTEDSFVNQMSTEQAMYALTAYYRGLSDEKGLYDMADSGKSKKNIKSNKGVKKKKASTTQKKNKVKNKNSKKEQKVSQKEEQNSLQESNENTSQNTEKNINKKKKSEKKTEKKVQEENSKGENTTEESNEVNTTKEKNKEVKEKSTEKNYSWIGIVLGVLGLLAAGVLLKRKNKLFIMLIVVCLFFSGCGNRTASESVGKCTILVECSTIYDNLDDLDKGLKGHIPKDGIILKEQEVDFQKDDSVYDVLSRELKKNNILMEVSFTGKNAYIEGIDNIYEFSCGSLSGWKYSVNDEYPQVSCSDYKVKDGDKIKWHYTCDLGEDVK